MKGEAVGRRLSQTAGSKPTNVLPTLLRGRWRGNSLGAPRSRANRRTKYRVGVVLLDTQLRKSDAPHRKEIGAPYRPRFAGSGQLIRSIVRAPRRRLGASAQPRSPKDRTTGARVEEAPGPLVSREM